MTTPDEQGRPDEGHSAYFAYYMIRLSQPRVEVGGGDGELAGMVERLATGEKRSFESAGELVQLLGAWPPRRRSIEGPALG